jgi:hypothetical protein
MLQRKGLKISDFADKKAFIVESNSTAHPFRWSEKIVSTSVV